MSSRLLALSCPSLLLILIVACGDEDKEASTATPASGVASPVATSASPSQPGALVTPGPARKTVDLAVTEPRFAVYGADPGDMRSDIPAIALGDFNGDDVQDLLIGARFGDGPDNSREDAGEAYVIFGSSGLRGALDLAQDAPDVTIYGAQPGDDLGLWVAGGDLNNDGIDDIIVSSPSSFGPPEPRTFSGEAYAIYGSRNLPPVIDIAEGQQDVTFIGAEGGGRLGDSLAVGDVNGDGMDDLVLGAPFAGRMPGTPVGGPRTEEGRVYVTFGSPSLPKTVSTRLDQQDFTIAGVEAFDETGDAVAVGDVNGDGVGDIVVVAEAADGPDNARENAGEAFVFLGSPELGGLASIADGDQALTILGAESQDTLGFSVDTGDINGDGIDDILLGARLADGPNNTRDIAGEAYVIFGSRELGGTIDLAHDAPGITVIGPHAGGLLGAFVAIGDVNSDGFGDLILGQPLGQSGGKRSGRVSIVFSSEELAGTIDLAESGPDILLVGANADDRFGSPVVVGEVGGDDGPELAALAQDADGPAGARQDVGAVYLLPISELLLSWRGPERRIPRAGLASQCHEMLRVCSSELA